MLGPEAFWLPASFSMLGLEVATSSSPSSKVGPDSSSWMRLQRRVEFVDSSEEVYSSVLDELVLSSWVSLRLNIFMAILLLRRAFVLVCVRRVGQVLLGCWEGYGVWFAVVVW